MYTLRIVLALALCSTAVTAGGAQAPRTARIDMELATEPNAPPTASQQWYKLLAELHVDNLRVRAAGATDKPTVAAAGRQEAPVYKVVGMLSRTGELVLPGGRFRAGDRAQLAAWLTKLRDEGPERARGGPRLPFGLTKEQFAEVHQDLSRAIGFSTKGLAAGDFVHRFADLVQYPTTGDVAAEALLAAARPIGVELKALSAGTAMAFVLDRLGLAFAPRLDARRQPSYAIAPARQKQERWPIGWPAKQPKRDLLPSLFDTVEVELNDVELPRVLAAVAEHVPAPLLVDEPALAAEKVDLGKIKVSLPAKRSIYESVLDKVLVPKMLVHELRVDDAGRPFLWITTARKGAGSTAKSKEPPP